MTTLRNDYVCMAFRRLHKLHVHGPNGLQVLFDNRFDGAAALGDVASQTANETNVVRRIDKDLDIHLLEQTRIDKDQDSFDDDDRFRLDRPRFIQTRVRLEVIKWQLNRFTHLQASHVIDEQFVVERVRMIEVCEAAVIERQIGEVAVVGVLLDENYFAGADRFKDAIRDGGLSRSRSTRNANYHAHASKTV